MYCGVQASVNHTDVALALRRKENLQPGQELNLDLIAHTG